MICYLLALFINSSHLSLIQSLLWLVRVALLSHLWLTNSALAIQWCPRVSMRPASFDQILTRVLCSDTHRHTHVHTPAVFEDSRRRSLQENGIAQHDSLAVVQYAHSLFLPQHKSPAVAWKDCSPPVVVVVMSAHPDIWSKRGGIQKHSNG